MRFFDENQTFFGSLDSHNGTSNYNKRLYSSLFNAPPELCQEFLTELVGSSAHIIEPRFNLCVLGHLKEFLDNLKACDSYYDECLMHRFILNSPKPVFFKAAQIRSACTSETISLAKIFFFLFKIHKEKREYIFKDESKIDSVHDKYKGLIEKTNELDSFIR